MSIKLVSVNIEGQKHLDKVRELIGRENPEVVCLMEVYDFDLISLAGEQYPHYVYVPNNVVREAVTGQPRLTLGVAILSKKPIDNHQALYCDGKNEQTIDKLGVGTHSPVVLLAKIDQYNIGAVHFTWTPEASVTARQRAHVEELLKMIKEKELVLCGDFNIPRGNEMYLELVKKFKDNIPVEIKTTLDPDLHYANKAERGKLKLVVDYVWTCLPAGRVLPKYKVKNVRVISGVSDHCAIACEVVI